MKRLRCSITGDRFFGKLALGVLALFLTAAPGNAQEPSPSSDASAESSRIHITADQLITHTNDKLVEFIGNVQASQGATVVTADRLKVFYRESETQQEQPASESDAISRIVAEGNVRIVFDDQVATAEQADYLADQRIMILSGKDTKITSGSNSISGTKITLFRDEGRIQVESSKEKRVEAYFHSQENGLGISPGKSGP